METIGNAKLWSFVNDSGRIEATTNSKVRAYEGLYVSSYIDLASKIAELQYRNKESILLFRGQNHDYKNKKKNTALKSSIFRLKGGITDLELGRRFDKLRACESLLIKAYSELTKEKNYIGITDIRRHRVVRWSILQHYEVCGTPLLDVTQSIRIAASFASIGATDNAILYVLAVPNLNGGITASAEAKLQIVRLSSVCPPAALRPHIQEGYLLGEYPDIAEIDQKREYKAYEIDFGLRLIAKFRFNPSRFWDQKNFPKIQKEALFPNETDPFFLALKKTVGANLDSG